MRAMGLTLAVAGTAWLAGGAAAQEATAELPDQLSWSAYDTGSAGYNQAVAIGAALQNELGTNLRVLPGKNDVSRTEPLRQGRVDFSATGVGGSFMAQEGAFEFGAQNWGPQRIRVLLANNGGAINLAVGVAGDAGIETYGDLAGKRVAWVVGAPALNVNTEAYLAYGGLTWDDVERVDFGGFGASWQGLMEGQVDAAFASTNSGHGLRGGDGAAGPRLAADRSRRRRRGWNGCRPSRPSSSPTSPPWGPPSTAPTATRARATPIRCWSRWRRRTRTWPTR